MVTEVADFLVDAHRRAEFQIAIAHGVKTVLSKAKGYITHKILACHETQGRFLLIVEWESIEDHTHGFRESPAFQDWRSIIGPFFKQPPHMEHFVVFDQA